MRDERLRRQLGLDQEDLKASEDRAWQAGLQARGRTRAIVGTTGATMVVATLAIVLWPQVPEQESVDPAPRLVEEALEPLASEPGGKAPAEKQPWRADLPPLPEDVRSRVHQRFADLSASFGPGEGDQYFGVLFGDQERAGLPVALALAGVTTVEPYSEEL
jgi:hypothetical protein